MNKLVNFLKSKNYSRPAIKHFFSLKMGIFRARFKFFGPGLKKSVIKPETKTASQNYFFRFSVQEQVMLAKRLAVLISAGVPLLSALAMLKKQAASKNGAVILQSLLAQVENGGLLSDGLVEFQKFFGEFSINIIRVGEASGTLSSSLAYLAEELRKKQELRRSITNALVYPVFIVFATLAITVLLIAYVFPKILPIFKSFKTPLPWTTRTLIFISGVFLHYGLYIFLVLLTILAAGIWFFKKESVRLWCDRKILSIPFLGKLVQNYQIANFTRTLGLLLKSEVKITEALRVVARVSGNSAYREEFFIMTEAVTRGQKLSAHMESNLNFFPALVSQMVEVGEATGNLSETLTYLSEMYEDELNNLTKNLSASIEPALMVLMGLLVGFIAISIITPIYGITQNLHP
jgi:type II secretory pathway component PulF